MTSTAIELLESCGAAGIDHPGGTLLAHLLRVRDLLTEWGARPALVQAGLCHACYGTDGFDTVLLPLDRRSVLADVVGAETEELVYQYASCDRAASYPTLAEPDALLRDRFTGERRTLTTGERRDVAELTAANELDIVRVNPELRKRWGAAVLTLLTRLDPLLSDNARRARTTLLT